MVVSVAHLGPPGTNTEAAAEAYVNRLAGEPGQQALLCPYPSIAQTLQAVAQGQADLAVVPVENSVEGSVSMTLDTLWHLDRLQIQHALEDVYKINLKQLSNDDYGLIDVTLNAS